MFGSFWEQGSSSRENSSPSKFDGTISLYLATSALATGASCFCYFRALQLGEASRVAPIDKLSVVPAALIPAVLLAENPSLFGWLGVALIAAGAILVATASEFLPFREALSTYRTSLIAAISTRHLKRSLLLSKSVYNETYFGFTRLDVRHFSFAATDLSPVNIARCIHHSG